MARATSVAAKPDWRLGQMPSRVRGDGSAGAAPKRLAKEKRRAVDGNGGTR
jgi:hypothetical protein